MRLRWTWILAAASIALLVSLPPAAASSPIPGTGIQVVDLGSATQALPFGGSANFSWALYNAGSANATLNVSARASDPSFRVSVSPTSFLLPQDGLEHVYVTVSAPASTSLRSASIEVSFQVLSPTVAILTRSVIVNLEITPLSLDVLTAFLAVGAIILIGFTAVWIFERTRVPDLLILIFLGLFLGPIALRYFGVAFVPAAILGLATPYFTAVALMIILFDGGLDLRIREVVRHLGVVGVHAGTAFALSFFAVAFVAHFLLGYDWIVAFLLGAVLDGTSGAVVIGIMRVLRVSEETKIILTLESVLTDVLAVVFALAFIEVLRGGPDTSFLIVFRELGEAFLIALALGLLAGVGWIVLLRRVERKPFSYMLTLALLFLLYAGTELAGGSGAMAAFIFGLVLGNHEGLERRLRLRSRFVIDARIRQFHSELSFLVRTFFFVFLGLVFTFEISGNWSVSTELPILSAWNGTFLLFLIGVAVIFVLFVAVRIMTVRITVALRPASVAERRVLWSVMGRGLTTAVLASLPFTIPAFTSPATSGDLYYQAVMAPYQTQFLNLAFFIILLTVGVTTLGVAAAERALGKAAPPRLLADIDPAALEFLQETDTDDLRVWHRPPGPQR